MNIKSITGSSIHAALIDARRTFGDDVVLLESVPPKDGQPARITIMADEPLPKPKKAAPQVRKPVPAAPIPEPELVGEAVAPQRGYGYAATDRGITRAEAPARSEATQRSPKMNVPGNDPGRLVTTRPARRENLFERKPAKSGPTPFEEGVMARLDELQARLASFEDRMGNVFIGAAQPWMGHPLYTGLLGKGLKPKTLTKLFSAVWNQGHEWDDDPAKIQWALARELRGMLDGGSTRLSTGAHLFIGPGGAGKTSLQIKLARHSQFFGRLGATGIVIPPEDESEMPYHSPVDLYRRFGLPVQKVDTPEALAEALGRTENFSHVLIDTPSMPLEAEAQKAFLVRISRMIRGIAPMQIHLVLNTARVLDDLDAAFLDRLPLRPDTLALTHLDETTQLGRIAECLMAIKLPVQFVSDGPQIADSVDGFSPSLLVEQIFDFKANPDQHARPDQSFSIGRLR